MDARGRATQRAVAEDAGSHRCAEDEGGRQSAGGGPRDNARDPGPAAGDGKPHQQQQQRRDQPVSAMANAFAKLKK
jgi:hypothetical protein